MSVHLLIIYTLRFHFHGTSRRGSLYQLAQYLCSLCLCIICYQFNPVHHVPDSCRRQRPVPNSKKKNTSLQVERFTIAGRSISATFHRYSGQCEGLHPGKRKNEPTDQLKHFQEWVAPRWQRRHGVPRPSNGSLLFSASTDTLRARASPTDGQSSRQASTSSIAARQSSRHRSCDHSWQTSLE